MSLAFCVGLMVSLPVAGAWADHALSTDAGKLRLPPPPAWGDIGGWNQPKYYATIQLADIDGDGQAELIGRWAGGILINHFDAASDSWVARRPGPALSDSAHWDQPQYYTTIQFADIDGDGQAELVARGPDGIATWHYNPQEDSWTALQTGGPFADVPRSARDATRWDQPQYYTTIHLADIDGRPGAELIARGAEGLQAYRYERKTHTWSPLAGIPELNDSNGWDRPERYSTIQLADVDGRPGAELAARGADGLHIYSYDARARSWTLLATVTELNDAQGWDKPERYSTIHLADIDGQAGAEIVAIAPDGLHAYRYEKESASLAPLASLSRLSDAGGWNRPEYRNTIQFADVDGQPGAEVIARGSQGIAVWRYSPKANRWTSLEGAAIPRLSDAAGWSVPSQYLTIQAANIDGRAGAEIIGRSATGIETWRFAGPNSTASQVTAGTGFPPYNTPPQSTYYAYISKNLGYGSDIRASYDTLGDSDIENALNTLNSLQPPDNTSPMDWGTVKNQITTELKYVETANDWIFGDHGSAAVLQQIFTATSLNVEAVASVLTNIDTSSTVGAEIADLLLRIIQGVGALSGVPAASGIASLLATMGTALENEGKAPNLTIAIGQIDGQLETMYNAAMDAANTTHAGLVTNWPQLQAFAQSRVGHVPSDDDVIAIRWAGDVQYAEWIWRTITPAVWVRVTPTPEGGIAPGCFNAQLPGSGYPAPVWYYNGSGSCGPAWIGMTCGYFSGCYVPPTAALTEAFGKCASTAENRCPDPVNGPFDFPPADVYQSQNGWNLPCTGPDCGILLAGSLGAERVGEIAEAQSALRSLATQVRNAVSDAGLQQTLAAPLEAASSVLADGSLTQQDFGIGTLGNFVLQVETLPVWQLDPAQKWRLIATANSIRSQLTGPAPEEVVYTRHSRTQTM